MALSLKVVTAEDKSMPSRIPTVTQNGQHQASVPAASAGCCTRVITAPCPGGIGPGYYIAVLDSYWEQLGSRERHSSNVGETEPHAGMCIEEHPQHWEVTCENSQETKDWKVRDSIHALSSAQTLLATDSSSLDRKKSQHKVAARRVSFSVMMWRRRRLGNKCRWGCSSPFHPCCLSACTYLNTCQWDLVSISTLQPLTRLQWGYCDTEAFAGFEGKNLSLIWEVFLPTPKRQTRYAPKEGRQNLAFTT